jgi:hypothetical protein
MNIFYYSSTWYPALIALKHTGPQKGREVEKAIGELDKTMAAAAASHMLRC